jgi:hypothetical protein
VNGFISHLCRLGLKSFDKRDELIRRAVVRGNYSIMPLYSNELLELIRTKYEESKKDKEEGAQKRAELLMRL